VPVVQIGKGVPGDSDIACGKWIAAFGDEQLERQVDGDRRRGEHQRCAAFGVAEDHKLGGRHLQAYGRGLAAVVDDLEELDALGGKNGCEARYGVIDGVVGRDGDEAGILGGHGGSASSIQQRC
jgi:hypothetical protein